MRERDKTGTGKKGYTRYIECLTQTLRLRSQLTNLNHEFKHMYETNKRCTNISQDHHCSDDSYV